MKIPTGRAFGPMRQVVRINASEYTIERPNETVGRYGDTNDPSAESSSTHTEDVFLFSPQDAIAETEFGERQNADMEGLALGESDIQAHDRLTENGVPYEVETTEYLPSENDKQVLDMMLVKRVND